MIFDNKLQDYFKNSIEQLLEEKFDKIRIENIFYFILKNDEETNILLDNNGCKIEILKKELSLYIDTFEKTEDKKLPVGTVFFEKVIQKSILFSKSFNKEFVDTMDIIHEILDLNENENLISILKKSELDIEATKKEIVEKNKSIFKEQNKEKDIVTENNNFNPIHLKSRFENNNKEDKFITDMNKMYKEGLIGKVVGREKELNQLYKVLLRKKKNNPILVGEAGVGKTSILEKLVEEIANGSVIKELEGFTVLNLNINALISGTKYRGDFEQRVEDLIKKVSDKKNKYIIFIDEFHNAIDAGGGSNGVDLLQVLKPYLSTGNIKLIGATTNEEYKKYVEKDKALVRRFEKINVSEPTIEESIEMIKNIKFEYEEFHSVKYTEKAIETAVKIGKQYLKNRNLPDLAISIIDDASSENKLLSEPKDLITEDEILAVISNIIGNKNISKNFKDLFSTIEENLKKEVFNQDESIKSIVHNLLSHNAGIVKKEKPIGVYLLNGKPGTGKTHLTKVLSENLNMKLIRLDMSEYMEEHSSSKILGSPAGYVGYDDGSYIVDKMKEYNGNCIIVLDEVDKAHKNVLNTFLQIFDYGTLKTNKGEEINFRNSLIFMTSNIGTNETKSIGFNGDIKTEQNKFIKKYFSSEFLNRIDEVIHFTDLLESDYKEIFDKELSNIKNELLNRDIKIIINDKVSDFIINKVIEDNIGARPINRYIEKLLLPEISKKIIYSNDDIKKMELILKEESIVAV